MASLHDALSAGKFRHFHHILQRGAHPDDVDKNGLTPLMKCGGLPYRIATKCIEWLVAYDADLTLPQADGMDALGHFVWTDRRDLALFLLNDYDLDLTHKDNAGNTALHLAVIKDKVNLVMALLKALRTYKISVDQENNAGYTPIMIACQKGYADIVRILVNYGKASLPLGRNRYFGNVSDWVRSMGLMVEPERKSTQTKRRVKSAGARLTVDKPQNRPPADSMSPTCRRASTAFDGSSSEMRSTEMTINMLQREKRSYRHELARLYRIYEQQLSYSYRPTVEIKFESHEQEEESVDGSSLSGSAPTSASTRVGSAKSVLSALRGGSPAKMLMRKGFSKLHGDDSLSSSTQSLSSVTTKGLLRKRLQNHGDEVRTTSPDLIQLHGKGGPKFSHLMRAAKSSKIKAKPVEPHVTKEEGTTNVASTAGKFAGLLNKSKIKRPEIVHETGIDKEAHFDRKLASLITST